MTQKRHRVGTYIYYSEVTEVVWGSVVMLFALPILISVAIVLSLGFLGMAGINYLFPSTQQDRRD